ncbi:hypothetical protein T11_10239 [Trichinella zimbabwensis]|uniref:Uncharacterized protein n=1 Tax=Trichinella zimbabwensis TaxID=268475 RepID=A0A0V1HP71_9BILA|nr:hypothetical protein T11_10239 [Trichinella zimbabwensis]
MNSNKNSIFYYSCYYHHTMRQPPLQKAHFQEDHFLFQNTNNFVSIVDGWMDGKELQTLGFSQNVEFYISDSCSA